MTATVTAQFSDTVTYCLITIDAEHSIEISETDGGYRAAFRKGDVPTLLLGADGCWFDATPERIKSGDEITWTDRAELMAAVATFV